MNKAFREWEEKNIQKGREEGERSNAIQSVRMLLKNGVSLELVSSSILVLSKEEIEEIYKEVCETV